MSTYLHLQCTAHTPHINSEEIGNRCAKTVAEMHAERTKIVAVMQGARDIGADVNFLLDEQNRTARFFTEHPNCPLELWDEYGHKWCLTCGADMEAHEGKVLCQQYEVTQWVCASCNGSMTS